jgi:rhomboid family GlyGly-CTERM serine protease
MGDTLTLNLIKRQYNKHGVTLRGLRGRKYSSYGSAMQLLSGIAHWRVALAFALFCALATAFGDDATELLRYDRVALADGEYWRLLSGHFVHLGYPHLLLNLLGLLLVWLLVGRLYSTPQWLLVALASVLAIDAGFWFLDTDMRWYVGLSGMLHGLLLAGAVSGYRSLPAESLVIAAVVIAKLAYEQIVGPLPGSEALAGGSVIVNSHSYGAIGGALSAFIIRHSVRRPASI